MSEATTPPNPFSHLNEKIGIFMEKTLQDHKSKMTKNRLAREMTIRALRCLPEKELGEIKFGETGDNSISEDDIKDYLNNHHQEGVKISEINCRTENINGKVLTLPHHYTGSMITRWFKGSTPVPLNDLKIFCDCCEVSIDDFLKTIYSGDDINDVTLSQKKSPTKDKVNSSVVINNEEVDAPFALLQKIFKDEHGYVFNSKNMDFIFPNRSDKFTLNFAHPKVRKDKMVIIDADGKEVEIAFQRGTLTFTRDKHKNGVCHVKGTLDVDSKGGRNAELEGVALNLSLDTTNATCWCFLKRKKSENIILWAICFKLNTRRGGSVWETPRIAYLLSLRTRDSLPLIHRVILWQSDHEELKCQPLTDDEIKSLLGFARLNTEQIKIKHDDWATTESYFKILNENINCEVAEDKYTEIKKHFENIGENALKDVIEAFYNLNPFDENHVFLDYRDNAKTTLMGTHRNLLERVPMLTSWLRRIDQHQDYNKLEDSLNVDIAKMFTELLKQRENFSQ